ncbi:MAG: hypothetical protein K2J46_04030 [Muribaculaceae bacterium]|nr:hypothetical protein [Muribaculaceae bacterium]
MKMTPLQETVKRLDSTLTSKDIEIARWVIDYARPPIAVRQNNLVTVCFDCGNTMVYAGSERFVKCVECERTVEVIEEQDWLASKRIISRYFASLEVLESIQVMRTFEVIHRYSALNRLKDVTAREVCRHWITADGRWAVTSQRRFTGFLVPKAKSMKLRKGSAETEDHIANHAFILPDVSLLPELEMKLASIEMLMPGNALTNIRNLLEPDYSII